MADGRQKAKNRPLDESLDNVARFFRKVAVAVVRDGGLFVDDALTSNECAMIATHCAKIESALEQQAAELRVALIRREEDQGLDGPAPRG